MRVYPQAVSIQTRSSGDNDPPRTPVDMAKENKEGKIDDDTVGCAHFIEYYYYK